ncbi:MAG: tRNA (N6-threonylcarbamoyladenosine(37)-N6)-methyltransferase TrmO [Eubacterium sp.]
MEIRPVARIFNCYSDKFGVPRQSALIEETLSEIRFLKPYSNPDAVRELEGFSHIWLIWQFDKSMTDKFTATVRPPRLGGNKRVGVFASRSPFRPNNLGLSCVKLEEIKFNESNQPVLIVSGADLISGTPIFDIKPYISFSDCRTDAVSGYADEMKDYALTVENTDKLDYINDIKLRDTIIKILESDPRPSYQNDENRIYGFTVGGYEIKFKVKDGKAVITEAKNG